MKDVSKELSRDFVSRCIMEVLDEAVKNTRWGHLSFIVEFKDGKMQRIKRYFEETLTADSLKS
jgi:hypothetical protein